jgi:hypothetical protein
MDELKSAWEIAEQRASRLGRLSAEEQKQQERDRCRQIGRVLAGKWLDVSEKLNLPAELGRHGPEEQALMKHAVIEHLVEAIEPSAPGNVDRVTRAIDGIQSLAPELQPEMDEMRGLLHEYEGAERKARQEIESGFRETLHRMRIAGTAVAGINIEATEEWQAARQRLVEAFTPRFSEVKRTLTCAE